MDRERLDRLMTDPTRVGRTDIADLKAMTERYPWFSGAHLLLAVGEHAAGDLLFDEQLRTTAAHLPSRAVLFDHVVAHPAVDAREAAAVTPSPAPVIAVEPAPLVVVPKDPPAAIAPPPAPSWPEVTAPTIAMPMSEVPDGADDDREEEEQEVVQVQHAPPPPIAVAPPPAAPPIEMVSAAREEAPGQAPGEEADPLDLQIREAALASSYELTWDFEAELATARVDDAPAAPVPPSPQRPAPSAPPPAPVPITPGTRKRFTDWLELAPPPEPADLPEGMRLDQIAAAPDANDWLREGDAAAEPAPAQPAPPAAASDTKQLIDRFIQQAAGQPPKKAEFFTPQQAAKRSLDDHTDLVSETLARVYEKQGNYAKAIAAYERLALKHPDKSAYFAALSEALRARTSR